MQGHKLPEGLSATGDIQEMVARCAVILMVVPTPFVERTLKPLADALRPDQASAVLARAAHHGVQLGRLWEAGPCMHSSLTSMHWLGKL